jgi:RNase P subunit RPR2
MTNKNKLKQPKCPHCKKLVGNLLMSMVSVRDQPSSQGEYDEAVVYICPNCQAILHFEEPRTMGEILFAISAIGKKIGALKYDRNKTLRDISEG